MQSFAVKSALIVVVASMATSCLTRPPVARLSQRTPIAMVLLRDSVMDKKTYAVPKAISDKLKERLEVRNLYVPDTASKPHHALADIRDTTRRREFLLRAQPSAEHLLLVESQVVFYSQLNGRYKWDVDVKLSIGGRDRPEPMVERQFKLSAFLPFDHQREDAALDSVGDIIAGRTADLVDSYFSSKPKWQPLPATRESPMPSGKKSPPANPEPPASKDAQKSATSQPQAASDAVYFLMVDRFHNGDRANDGQDVAPADAKGWHGGDLQGVIDKLDYLQQLGIRTLWLSPIFKSRRQGFLGHGAFHGYWVEDFQRIDPHFGSPAVLKKLGFELKRRNMRLLLDLVVNHVGYDAPLLRTHPNWFHNKGSIVDWQDPIQIVTHDVHGLPDLAQERQDVYRHLLKAASHWLSDYPVAGFRLDAVKHVSLAFWRRFNDALKKKAPGLFS